MSEPIIGLRDPLAVFAMDMERELRENDHKGDWRAGGFTMQMALH